MVKEIDDIGRIVYRDENEKIHREDGPAGIYPDGTVCWYLNGKLYSFNNWIEKVNISGEKKMELILKYG